MTFAKPDLPEEARRPEGLFVTTLNGAVHIIHEGRNYVVKVFGANGSGVKTEERRSAEKGVEVELKEFVEAIEGKSEGKPDNGDVRGALWDVALIEALLTSEGKEVNLEALLGN